MKRIWATFRRFWLEEEVPRWIGLSLVAVYVCGLVGVAYVAQRQATELAQRSALAHGDHAMSLLAQLLAKVAATDMDRQQAMLREFAGRLECEQLYVADESGMVIASIDPDDLGRPSPLTAAFGAGRGGGRGALPEGSGGFDLASDEADTLRRYYRLPLAGSGRAVDVGHSGQAEGGGVLSGTSRRLEGVLRWDAATVLSCGQTWLLGTVLAAMAVLGTVYHLMRRHFREVSCIADNLVTHADRLAEELTALRVADSLGAVASSWNKLIDLTESFRADAGRCSAASELRQVLERSGSSELADAVDAVPDGLLIVTDEDLLVHSNTAAARLMGWNPNATARARLPELKPSEIGRAVLDVVAKARGADGCYEEHQALVEHGGSNYRVRVVPQRKGRPHGACVVVIVDVSQQMRTDRAREEFVSQVTHELRTPLTNIRAYTETLSSGMFDDPKVVSECYNVINKETRRLARLVEDILSVSQLEVGSIQMVLDPVDVRDLIQEAMRDLRATADEKKIDLQATLPAKLEPIQADKDKLMVVLNNLLGNALKYTPRGGEVRVGCQTTEEHLLITVKDNGIGVDKADQEHVFEKFHRSADPEVQKQPGTGIGLTTAREIARRHGGDIELMSEKGKGSTFVVKLPRRKAAVPSPGMAPALEVPAEVPRGGR
ncbi:MAG: ATP-binding protein [Planctomycetota bacterium]